MKAYLVGGAVRDQLLGRPAADRDWVVVGETPESMQARGFRQIAKDFPIFLHPESREEYALARTERKSAPGYRGFVVHASPDITLEQDLERRDLTINAIAMTPDGDLIDPFGGAVDLKNRILRHVSPAFQEDPVRLLRVARFSARYSGLGFRIADETLQLLRDIVAADEVDALVPERVFAELSKALTEAHPRAFFEVLRSCGALERLFPELDRLFGIPQPAKHHPEIDTGIHVLMALDQIAARTNDPVVRFAVLVHDLGKALTNPTYWPRHADHEELGLPGLESLCDRLKVPNTYRRLAEKVMRYHTHCHRAMELRPAKTTDLLQALGACQKNSSFEDFLLACEADARGRLGLENRDYPQADWLRAAREAMLSVSTKPLLDKGFTGEKLGYELRQARIAAVRACYQRLRLAEESNGSMIQELSEAPFP